MAKEKKQEQKAQKQNVNARTTISITKTLKGKLDAYMHKNNIRFMEDAIVSLLE